MMAEFVYHRGQWLTNQRLDYIFSLKKPTNLVGVLRLSDVPFRAYFGSSGTMITIAENYPRT